MADKIDPLVVAMTEERERLGLGIRELARRAGMGHYPGRISEIELGYVSPTLATLRKVAAGLGCDLALVSLPCLPPSDVQPTTQPEGESNG